MQLVERHIIKISNKFFNECDSLCFASKNLYNCANYNIRQGFIFGKTYSNYNLLDKALKETIEYKALPAKVAQQVLRVLERNWRSFFAAIAEWRENPGKFTGRPKLPKYKDKQKGRIISVGRLVEKKGLKYLIDACAILASRGCKFSCQIIGTGELEIALCERIVRLGLQKTVKIIGPRPQNEVFQMLQQAAVFAAPYIIAKDGNRDGLPTVLLEAMALGTPCVGADVTGMPEVISDRTTGLKIRQNDPVTLADALEEILQDPNLRVRLATRSRQLVESEFDIDKNTARMRSLFEAISRESSQQSISGEKESVLQLEPNVTKSWAFNN